MRNSLLCASEALLESVVNRAHHAPTTASNDPHPALPRVPLVPNTVATVLICVKRTNFWRSFLNPALLALPYAKKKGRLPATPHPSAICETLSASGLKHTKARRGRSATRRVSRRGIRASGLKRTSCRFWPLSGQVVSRRGIRASGLKQTRPKLISGTGVPSVEEESAPAV